MPTLTEEEFDKRKKAIMAKVHIREKRCECCRNTVEALLLIDELESLSTPPKKEEHE